MMNSQFKGIMIGRLQIGFIIGDFFFIGFTLAKLESKFGIHFGAKFISGASTIENIATNFGAELAVFTDKMNLSPSINFFLNSRIW